MSVVEIVALLVAGMLAGTINTVVGSGTLITVPTLLLFGYPAVVANVTNTVGLVPGIKRLGADFSGKVGLALSLHAPNDEIRNGIVPMNRRYPVRDVLEALREYPLPKRRRITIEYILIAGVNDGAPQARELARALRGLRVKVNLIPMNPITAASMASPEVSRVEAFKELLARDGYSVFVRKQRGDDVDAACGQLVLRERLERKAKESRCSDESS